MFNHCSSLKVLSASTQFELWTIVLLAMADTDLRCALKTRKSTVSVGIRTTAPTAIAMVKSTVQRCEAWQISPVHAELRGKLPFFCRVSSSIELLLRLSAAGRDKRKIVTAVGRELLGFIWAIGTRTETTARVPTREYQTDQSSLKPGPTAARPVLEKQLQRQKQPTDLTPPLHISAHRCLFGTSHGVFSFPELAAARCPQQTSIPTT
jgi:hypothetical protein